MITTGTITAAPTEGHGQQASLLARQAGTALQLGGVCWMGMYGLEVVVGLATGQSLGPAHLSALARVDSVALLGGGILFALGLLGLRARLQGRARGFGIVGAAFATISLVAGAAGLVMTDILGRAVTASTFGSIALLSVLLGTTLLAIAAKRARALPRRASTALLLAGALTFPLAVATVPIGHVIPDWILDNLLLALGGVAFAAAGAVMAPRQDGAAGRCCTTPRRCP